MLLRLTAPPTLGLATPPARQPRPAPPPPCVTLHPIPRHLNHPQPPAAGGPGSSDGAASAEGDSGEEVDDFTGLLPEEDFEVPGSPNDSMTSNTPLGRAVGAACDELADLAALEAEAADAAAALLLKLGYRVSKEAAAVAEGGAGEGEGDQQQG